MAMCIPSGLVGGEAFSVDASLIKADVDKKKRIPGEQPISWPKPAAVREYLAALGTADNDEKNGGGDVGGSSGSGSRSKPAKEVSLTDPQAAFVARRGVDPFFAYDANYLIDNKAGIILDAEGTRANRIAEIAVAQTMVERVRRRFDLQPQRLAGDTVYGAVRLLKWLGWIATSHRRSLDFLPARCKLRPGNRGWHGGNAAMFSKLLVALYLMFGAPVLIAFGYGAYLAALPSGSSGSSSSSGSTVTFSLVSSGSTIAVQNTTLTAPRGVPGPIAGAGLPVLVAGYSVYWLVRHRRRSP
jgi:hypothetical protein